jgi:hypothetical protein
MNKYLAYFFGSIFLSGIVYFILFYFNLIGGAGRGIYENLISVLINSIAITICIFVVNLFKNKK